MKKKIIIITICCICLGLIRAFTPYLGKPFFIYCFDGQTEGFHLSNDIKNIMLATGHEPCIKFIKYCTALEQIGVATTEATIDINDISNPNLKSMSLSGKCVNWSSLNNCTELEYLNTYQCNLTTIEDISELKKLETLNIHENQTELSLTKLNELKNITELTISCPNDIDCNDFSQLDRLEELYLNSNGKISNLDKMDSVTSLTLVHPDKEIGNDICDMDSLKEVHVFNSKFSDEVEKQLKEKNIVIKYHNS